MGRGREGRGGGKERHRKRNKYTVSQGRGRLREEAVEPEGMRGRRGDRGTHRAVKKPTRRHIRGTRGGEGDEWGERRDWGTQPPAVRGAGRGSLSGLDPLNPSCPAWNRGGILGGGCTNVSLCVPARGVPSLQEPRSSS